MHPYLQINDREIFIHINPYNIVIVLSWDKVFRKFKIVICRMKVKESFQCQMPDRFLFFYVAKHIPSLLYTFRA